MLTETHEGSLLTVKEAAALLGLHPMTVRKMIRQQRLPAVQIGGPGTSVRIPADELEQWLYGQQEAVAS
jgi:excisionase family DNA binding protein